MDPKAEPEQQRAAEEQQAIESTPEQPGDKDSSSKTQPDSEALPATSSTGQLDEEESPASSAASQPSEQERPATTSHIELDAQELPVTSSDSQVDALELPADSSDSQATEQRQATPPTEDRAEATTAPERPPKISFPSVEAPSPPPKVSFPKVRAQSPPTDEPFGVVSSNGQLVCEFKRDSNSRSPPPEDKIVGSESVYSEPKTLGGSVSPPPQAISRIEVSHMSTPPMSGRISNLELSVDHDSYPEVYISEEDQGPRLPPRKSPPMDQGSSVSTWSVSDFNKTAYLDNSHMSVRNPIDVPLVTPLHLLGDQSDTVDCPFCMRRVETKVIKKSSKKTHMWGTILFFSSVIGTFFPYCCGWYKNVEHHCKNCKRKIAHRTWDTTEFVPLGTDPALREVSRYEPAETKKRWRS